MLALCLIDVDVQSLYVSFHVIVHLVFNAPSLLFFHTDEYSSGVETFSQTGMVLDIVHTNAVSYENENN